MAFAENLDGFLADFGVVATYDTETATVLFDCPDQIVAGDVISAEYVITYKTGVLSGIRYGSQITINGESYTVHNTQRLDDGAFTIARLSKD